MYNTRVNPFQFVDSEVLPLIPYLLKVVPCSFRLKNGLYLI